LACLCLRRLRRFTWVGRTTRPWSPTAAVLAVAISAPALIATPAGEGTLSRGLRTPPLPAPHPPGGGRWQNSRCRHVLREEQHTSRDTLVSHAMEQNTGSRGPDLQIFRVSEAGGSPSDFAATGPVPNRVSARAVRPHSGKTADSKARGRCR